MNNVTRVSTRPGSRWCTRQGVIIGTPPNLLFRCTVQIRNSSSILLQSVSRQNTNDLPPFVSNTQSNVTYDSYFRFRMYSENDYGTLLSNKLRQAPSRLVGDGSYEKRDDSGAAAFIWECNDMSSRTTNATMVPSNAPSSLRTWNDPYRCELFALLLAVMTIYEMETRFKTTYKDIIIAVNNDSALDMAIVFHNKITPSDQHYDLICSIREVRSKIQTKLCPERVKGHKDDEIPWEDLSRLEQLNVECDQIAKHARSTMKDHMEVMSSLHLPYEKIGLYHEGIKLYKNFGPYMIEKCNERRAKTYCCRKYHWTPNQFRSIKWDALSGAMKRCTPSTSKLISKFSCGFVGTAKTLSRREYWLDSACPLCNVMEEDNTHIICCPHPPHRQRIEQSHGVHQFPTPTSCRDPTDKSIMDG